MMHTKGPWKIDTDGAYIYVVDTRGNNIVEGLPSPLYDADARLIATAPELLVACELALHFIETPGDFQPHERDGVIDDLTAALAKVRGEVP